MHRDEAIYARADAQTAALAAAWAEGWQACENAQHYIEGMQPVANPYDGLIWPEYKR